MMKIYIFEKRVQPRGLWFSIGITLFSIFLALCIGAIPIFLAGANPLFAYQALFYGAFGRLNGLVATCIKATPLLLSALAIIVAFKANLWNLGGNGQMYLGALMATLVGLFAKLPIYLHLPLALLAGFVGGVLWILPFAFFRAYLRVNEVIMTLMFNFIAIFFINWLVAGPLEEAGGYMPQTPAILPTARLPLIFPPTRLHAGIILAVVLAIFLYFLLFRTSFGYNLQAIGANPKAAQYGGINVKCSIVLIMGLSGGLMGLAGANEILGIHHRLLSGIVANYGFTGMVAALLGGLHPLGAVVAAFFFSSLIIGADMMQKMTGVPISSAYIIQALVVLFIVGGRVVGQYDFVPLRSFVLKYKQRQHLTLGSKRG